METEQELEEQRIAEEKQMLQDYQETFSTPQGKRTLDNLKVVCHYDMIMSCDDGMILSQWTGERNVIIHILKAMGRDLNENPRQMKAVDVNQQPVDNEGTVL